MTPHLRLVRSGGLAGIDMAAEVDLDDLDASDAARVRDALAKVRFARPRGGRAAGPGGPDRYQYTLEVTDGRRRSVTVHEPNVPPALQTVIDVLLPLARPQ